jgi:hypothetical protein
MAYGTVNADVISTSVANTSLGAGNATRFKNRIINGDMRIDQRNAGASVTITTANEYTLDRWQSFATVSSKYSVQQNAGSVTPPAGFSNYLGVTSLATTTVNASDYYLLCQKIEGFNTADLNWGTANAKTVTLSFWVCSSLIGDFGGSLMNSAENRAYPFSYTISSANTWTQVSVTIAGDTTGTWIGSTNGIGIKVWFSLGTGISFSGTSGAWTGLSSKYQPAGSTSIVGTNGATFYITGVQLEVGSSATGFDYRDYGSELIMCQRYYETLIANSFASPFALGSFLYTTTQAAIQGNYIVSKRTTPTYGLTSTGNYSSAIAGAIIGQGAYYIYNATGVGFTINGTANTPAAYFSAEL